MVRKARQISHFGHERYVPAGMQTSRARTEDLWKEFLRDPSQWCDKRKSKTNPRAPDFKHKLTQESLWMDCWYNPSWVQDRPWQERMNKAQQGKEEEEMKNSDGGSWRMLSLKEILSTLEEGVLPLLSIDDVAFILHMCRKEKDRAHALRLHAHMLKSGLEAHTSLGNYLISMLVDVGSIHDAQQVFDKLVYRNEWSWNALINGYIRSGRPQQALTLYQEMQKHNSVHPCGHTFAALLKACVKLKDLERGLEIHAEVARTGLLQRNLFVGSTLVDLYAKCGLLAKAQQVFDELPIRDVVSWTALIAGYAEHGHGEEALNCFEQMQLEGIYPDAVTFVCSLKACGSIGATDKGQEIHAEIERHGLLERNLVVGNTLVDMYAKCGLQSIAQQVFDKLPARNLVSWNALITGYAEHGHGEEALKRFEQMQREGVCPDTVTFICSLKACGSIGATDKGGEIHAEIERKGLLERDVFVGSTLVDMYAKCGLLAQAQQVFDKLPVRDVVLWTALMAGYAEHGHGKEALKCFERMQVEGVSPNAVTFACSLKACGSIGAADKGGEIHAEIERQGLLERDLLVGNTLVDMYAKCGLLAKAQQVFNRLRVRDVVSWNALIAGYAQLGESANVFNIFDRMLGEGIKPDPVTFVVVLSACLRTCLFSKSQTFFEAMSKDFGIVPTLEHHTCMVDLFGRAGQLDKAVSMIKKMPFCPNLVVWRTLLGACRNWGNVEFGKQAFENAVCLDEKDTVAYVFMSHIYAGADLQEEVINVKAKRV